jgi:ABC-type sugar transport system substrate-binding protein
MRRSVGLWCVAAISALAVSLALAACGGGGSSSGTEVSTAESPPTEAPPAASEPSGEGQEGESESAYYTPSHPGEMPQLGGAKQKEAEAAAVAAAKQEGGSVKPPEEGLTIGFLESVGEAETTERSLEAIEEAAGKFGWNVVPLDGMGDPAKIAANMSSLLNQGVDAIVGYNPAAPLIHQQLSEAESKGVPYINIGSGAEGIPVQYNFDQEKAWELLRSQMSSEFPPNPEVAVLYAPLLSSLKQTTERTIEYGKEQGWTIVGPSQLDLASLEQGAQAATASDLTSNPDLTAIIVDNSVSAASSAAVVKQRGKCGQVGVYTGLSEASEMALVREGCVTGLTDPPLGSITWAAIDQIAEHFARNGEMSEIPPDTEALTALYGINLFEPQTVTEANVPPDGSYQAPKKDSTSFFLKKWKLEFGK